MEELRRNLTLPLPGLPEVAHVSLAQAEKLGLGDFGGLPRSFLVLAEGILRASGPEEQIRSRLAVLKSGDQSTDIPFQPGRALLQDFMGIPLMTDLASMRDTLVARGADPLRVQPCIPIDFVIDHSLVVAHAGSSNALMLNRQFEMERNAERFAFIKWCQQNFDRLRVIPPGRGIMHQVNLEWLASVVRIVDSPSMMPLAVPDTMIGTDSHTTMINALGVLGWGVGGLEAEAAILGMPSDMVRPKVVGVRMEGCLAAGVTATDMVLHLTHMLRRLDVVGAFVEFHGPGVSALPVADRATIANMAPEFGATCAYFPIDTGTLNYLALTGRDSRHIELVEAYAKAQGLWQYADSPAPVFDENHIFDLDTVEPSLAGPVRPQDRVGLSHVPASFNKRMVEIGAAPREGGHGAIDHGAVVIAAITSCTNTSNPAVMLAAGLLAKKAVERGLRAKPWVKTSLSPGSRIVTDYLDEAGLTPALETLGFHNVGYGCATCNGNSGALSQTIAEEVRSRDLCVAAVLSGNRNFEGRIHPQVKAAYLASPPIVVAYAIAGSMHVDLSSEPLGTDPQGKPVMLADVWPSEDEIAEAVHRHVRADLFRGAYDSKIESTEAWETIATPPGPQFPWNPASSFIGPSPFVTENDDILENSRNFSGLRPLLVLGNSITTDHISPNGAIPPESPAGQYLLSCGLERSKLGNYGARRGNPAVCLRGMFDNRLLENSLAGGQRGNKTRVAGEQDFLSIYEAAQHYRTQRKSCIIVAGRTYGAGSSRDWAAKGVALLGVRAVLAESFERIHASNLIGMGILPLMLPHGLEAASLDVQAEDCFDLDVDSRTLAADMPVPVTLRKQGTARHFTARLLAKTESDLALLEGGGLLPTLLHTLSR
ncbi:aconitate hydratase AcnA [Aquamicrobium terrae]|uniref:Aconitate hydratase n=1 Tax=Aquamicrobium terrae TaxID=1324945 RepID=A0ABV2N3M3_9HYPH